MGFYATWVAYDVQAVSPEPAFHRVWVPPNIWAEHLAWPHTSSLVGFAALFSLVSQPRLVCTHSELTVGFKDCQPNTLLPDDLNMPAAARDRQLNSAAGWPGCKQVTALHTMIHELVRRAGFESMHTASM